MRTKQTNNKLSLECLEQRQLLTAVGGLVEITPQQMNLPYIEQDNLYRTVDQLQVTTEHTDSSIIDEMLAYGNEVRGSNGSRVVDWYNATN